LWSATSLQQDAEHARQCLAALSAQHSSTELTLQQEGEIHRPDKAGWCRLITQATQAIRSGEFSKVVLARATDLIFASALNAGALMAASRRVNFSCYHFYMAFDAQRTFLGSSPERLWRRRGLQLDTEALAGTVAGHDDDATAQRLGNWLMADDKNQRENGLVVDDICQRLQGMTQTLDVLPAEIVAYARSSICVAVFRPNWIRRMTRVVCCSCSPPRRWRGCPERRRWTLSNAKNPLPGNGMPGRLEFSPVVRASFASRCARRWSKVIRYGCMPAPVSWKAPIPNRNGRKSKTKRRDSVHYCSLNKTLSTHIKILLFVELILSRNI
jgi:hypothetical protein